MLYLYSKENCPQCLQLESLLKVKNIPVEVLKLDKDYTRAELEGKFIALNKPMARSFPVLFKDDALVGGLQEAKIAAVKGEL